MLTTHISDVVLTAVDSKLSMTEEGFEKKFRGTKDRVEWVHGKVIVMSLTSTQHVEILGFLHTIMNMFVAHHNLGKILGPELQLRLEAQKRRRVPDLLFVAKGRLDILQETYVDGPPDLVIEIVSPDSLARDWREKYLEYEAAGVQEYWVIDPMAKHAEAYHLDDEGQYQLIKPKDDRIHSTVLESFYLKPDWLWSEPLPNPLEILKELAVL